jgi:hypothetical protein
MRIITFCTVNTVVSATAILFRVFAGVQENYDRQHSPLTLTSIINLLHSYTHRSFLLSFDLEKKKSRRHGKESWVTNLINGITF